jgi:predicted nucleotidyltransferase
MNAHGLSRQTVERIQEVWAHFPEVRKAVLFGSRAKGTAKQGSDIDLALYGEGLDWRFDLPPLFGPGSMRDLVGCWVWFCCLA